MKTSMKNKVFANRVISIIASFAIVLYSFCPLGSSFKQVSAVQLDNGSSTLSTLNGTAQRGRPHLNAARTTFVADNGQPLRGPFVSTEWTAATPSDQIASIKNLGFNAVHLYAETFDAKYPASGSTSPGYASAQIDKIVEATRNNGLYLVITIGNGANNGSYNSQWAQDFWRFYAQRYAKETHVIFEIHNEPVAWGPPYSDSGATPPGAINMETACYKIIRQYAPDTPVLLFSYSVLGGTTGTDGALKDIHAFNTAIFGNENAVWTNEAVGFHGYAGTDGTTTAVDGILKAGYPCMMTEYAGSVWGTNTGGINVEQTSELERLGVSWLTFQHVPPTGVSDDISQPEHYATLVENAGLSWKPDYGTWPAARGAYGNGGFPRKTAENWVNNFLTGTTHIEAEDFDWGGEGISYHDSDSTNNGGQYRSNEAVDIETTSDVSGGYDVGWNTKGEWLEYTIWVQHPGYYNLSMRVANNGGGSVQVSCNNLDKTGTWTLPSTGGLKNWTTATKPVFLEYGQQKLHINVLSGGFNLNWIELSPTTTGSIPNGTYKFLNCSNTMALQGNDSKVITSSYTGSTNQQWKIKHIGGDQYQISSAANSMNWIQMLGLVWWGGTGSNQCYILKPTGDGHYRIISAENGLSLSISTQDSTKLEGEEYSEGANQEWGIMNLSDSSFPTGLTAFSSSNGANLTWNAMTGAASYNIKRSISSDGPFTSIATGITSTNYTDTSIKASTKYYYVVSAVIGGTETLNSCKTALQLPTSAFTQIEAESYNSNLGTQTEACSEGGQDIGCIQNGNYIAFKNIDFGSNPISFQARVASYYGGNNIEIRIDSIDGKLVGTCPVAATGGWQTWTTATCNISGISGVHDLYIKFTGGSGYLFNINWFKFISGITPTPTPTSTPTPTQKITPTPTQKVTPTPQSTISAFTQIEAENFSSQSGIQTESCSEGGQDIGFIENGDYAVYKNIDFGSGSSNFQARVASANSGNNIEIRLDSIDGKLVGTCPVTATSGWQTWGDATCSVSGVSGVHDLYLKFTGGSGYLLNVNWFKFVSSVTPTPTLKISPTSVTFNKSAPTDLTVAITDSNKADNPIVSVYNGSTRVVPVTQEQLTSTAAGYSAKFLQSYLNTLPAGTNTITFNFKNGQTLKLTINVVTSNIAISPISVTFNKAAPSDVVVAITDLNKADNPIVSVYNGSTRVVAVTQEQLTSIAGGYSGKFLQSYLNTLHVGANTITFNFKNGQTLKLTINVITSNITIAPTSATFNKAAPTDIIAAITAPNKAADPIVSVYNGTTQVVPGTQEQITSTTTGYRCKILQSYLNTLPLGSNTITFKFKSGSTVDFIVNVK